MELNHVIPTVSGDFHCLKKRQGGNFGCLSAVTRPTPFEDSPEGHSGLSSKALKTVDNPPPTIATVKSQLLRDLNQLAEALEALAEQKRQLEETIKQKSVELERLHQIKISAQTLDELRQRHHQEQINFTQDMARLRQTWEHEQKERQLTLEHEKRLDQIKRQQDNAQYRFERDQAWQKEEAGQLAKLAQCEQQLNERDQRLAQTEQEFNQLRAKAANFPKELETAIKQAENVLRIELTKVFEQEKKFLLQQMDNERKLSTQKTTTLENAVAAQKTEIDQLTKQLTEATRQLNQIAIKVIETGGSKIADNVPIIKSAKE